MSGLKNTYLLFKLKYERFFENYASTANGMSTNRSFTSNVRLRIGGKTTIRVKDLAWYILFPIFRKSSSEKCFHKNVCLGNPLMSKLGLLSKTSSVCLMGTCWIAPLLSCNFVSKANWKISTYQCKVQLTDTYWIISKLWLKMFFYFTDQ